MNKNCTIYFLFFSMNFIELGVDFLERLMYNSQATE